MSECKKYYWCASDDGGCWSDRSRLFDTQEECYADMMEHAVDKMKWNIEWDDVICDTASKKESNGLITTGEPIGYKLTVNADKIVHKSYSGTYTFQIKTEIQKPEIKTYRFNFSAVVDNNMEVKTTDYETARKIYREKLAQYVDDLERAAKQTKLGWMYDGNTNDEDEFLPPGETLKM